MKTEEDMPLEKREDGVEVVLCHDPVSLRFFSRAECF